MRIRSLVLPSFVLVSLVGWGLFIESPAAADMTLNIDKLSSNGMEVRKLSCKLSSGGLLGSVVIVAELAKHKKAFDACAAGGAAFATKFTWKDGKTKSAEVTASSDPKGNDCVAKTLKDTQAAVEGTCTAILLTGPLPKAEAAAAKLDK